MIYADYNGSAPLCEDVKEYLVNRFQTGPFANPNAIHHQGQQVLMAMENSRSVVAKALGAKMNQVIFNSGATEGCSTIFHSILDDALENGRSTIIMSGIEHSAIRNTANWYTENKGYELKTLPTTRDGIVEVEFLNKWIKEAPEKIAMVTVMAANNETGVIQPLKQISEICSANKIPFFCDTTQYIGKVPFSFKDSGIDYAITSGHKFGALTGTGILLAKDRTTLKPIIIGGGQEKGLRGGTQNYIGNETVAVALTTISKNFGKIEELARKRIKFETKIKNNYPSVYIIGEKAPRLATTTYIAYRGIHGQAVQIELESQGIFVTTSSACSDNEPVTSKVLKAMGLTDDIGRGVVRISVGLCSSLEVYEQIYEALSKAYDKLEQIKSY
ncbi:MAG: cysteine desulfurase [Bacteriovoracaceae bacterium]|jgi:cysteine desulfurase|nr:cysteine desulfurase [Bacteriovoracaceae bacterium]